MYNFLFVLMLKFFVILFYLTEIMSDRFIKCQEMIEVKHVISIKRNFKNSYGMIFFLYAMQEMIYKSFILRTRQQSIKFTELKI